MDAYAAEFFSGFNRIAGACRGGFLDSPLGRFEAPGFADGQAATLYLRPQDLRLSRGEGDDGIACRVISCALMGEIEQIHVAVAALSEPLKIRSTRRSRLRSGDTARLSVTPGQALIF